MYIYKEDSSKNTVRMASHIGLHNPMYCTGVGKAIMAYLPRSEQEQIWKATEIIPYTVKTITDYELMLKELDHIKECGYAIDDEEHENDVCCAACPILTIPICPTPQSAFPRRAHVWIMTEWNTGSFLSCLQLHAEFPG